MYNKSLILVGLSEKECVSITGGKEGDAAEGFGRFIGGMGGIIMEVVDFIFGGDPKMNAALMNCI